VGRAADHPQSPSGDARGRAIEEHLPLVSSLARRYARKGEPFEDLVQAGTVGLIKAVDRFDAQRGVAFSTYAVPVIEGEIRHHLRDAGSVVRVPPTALTLRFHSRYARTREKTAAYPRPAQATRGTSAQWRRSAPGMPAKTNSPRLLPNDHAQFRLEGKPR